MADISLDPVKHAGLKRVWEDAYGTQFGQDASTGQCYRLTDKGKKRTLAHVPPIIDVEAVVIPVEEPAKPRLPALCTVIAATALITTGTQT